MRDVRVIGDTQGQILLTLFLIVVALLPLQNNVLPELIVGVAPWLDWSWLLGLLLLGFYSWAFVSQRVRLHTGFVIASLLLTAILNLAGAIALLPPDRFALYRLVILLWCAPLLVMFFEHVRWRMLLLFGLVSVLLLHGQWAVLQFVVQGDLGFQLLGESDISSTIPGVAKFLLNGEKVVRAYGPYPHSNSLGAGMLVGLLYLSVLWRGGSIVSTHFRRTFYVVSGGVFVVALLLTFSRAAYAGLGLWFAINAFLYMRNEFVRSVLVRLFAISLLVFMVLSPVLYARFVDPEGVALTERLFGVEVSVAVIESLPTFRGAGLGRYVAVLDTYLMNNNVVVPHWQLQPVHSVPILILAELGWVFFLVVLLALLIVIYRGGALSLLLIPVLPLLVLDHYFYSQTTPGLLLLVVIVSLTMSHRLFSVLE